MSHKRQKRLVSRQSLCSGSRLDFTSANTTRQVLSFPAIGDTVLIPEMGEYTVKEPCENSNNGQWFCITHNQFFENQAQKDIHIHYGTHKMIWACRKHGLEVDRN